MAFTEATLTAEILSNAPGSNARITRFDATSSASYTDVTAENINTASRKTGTVQIAQSNTAAQAYTALVAGLSA